MTETNLQCNNDTTIMNNKRKVLTLKTINKSSVWELQENDIFRMWEAAERDADLKDNMRNYLEIIKTAFEIEPIMIDKPEVIKKFEQRGFKVAAIKADENGKVKMAIKKRAIMRVTDLTYENIRHISAAKLIEVLDRNFGSGWETLSQGIKDIIETGFDVSTTTLPKDRLRKPGGMYDKKMQEGYEVLEVEKGSWVEAIFAKEKTIVEIMPDDEDVEEAQPVLSDDEDDEAYDLPEDNLYDNEEDDDLYDEDRLTEESYRTDYDKDAPDDLSLADEVADEYED